MLLAHGATDKGRVRSINQDYWAFEASRGLCVVADGMGGHKAGEVAARLAVDAIVKSIEESEGAAWPFGFDPCLSHVGNRLRTAVHLAHMHILETSATSDQYAGMGTTIVACIVDGDRLSVAHAGDSRLYLLSGGGLRQVTHDDSSGSGDAGARTRRSRALREPSDARRADQRHRREASHQRHSVVEETLFGGEVLVLTTDGVHAVLENEDLEQAVRNGSSDVRGVAENLLAAALARGSQDDCTALIARYLRD